MATRLETTDIPHDSLAAAGAALAQRPYVRRGVPVSDEVIRLVLVDDHALVRAGLRALLRTARDVEVVGEAENGREALELVERCMPHVVAMDLDMPHGDGAEATRAIAALPNAPYVLVLTMHSEEQRLLPLLEAGASGFLSKDAADRELLDAIRVVAAGEVYVRPHIARRLAATPVARAATPEPNGTIDALSDRERTVLRLVAEGFNGPEIGRRLGISPKTVDTYRQRIEEKIGLSHRSEYVRLAISLGLLGG